jgi:hypothetical protein
MTRSNCYDSREAWLRAATTVLRPYFKSVGRIRFSIAFPSTGRRSNTIGECWPSEKSADGHFEVFIRPDQSDPVEVLGVLVHELVHAALPSCAGHGKLFKTAALKIGLEGKMRYAGPGVLLRARLAELAANLGPLPHAHLNIGRDAINQGPADRPADRPKKQGTRLLKAECRGCGYNVRITARWVRDVGPPLCPVHGAMTVNLPVGQLAPASQRSATPSAPGIMARR